MHKPNTSLRGDEAPSWNAQLQGPHGTRWPPGCKDVRGQAFRAGRRSSICLTYESPTLDEGAA